MPSPLPNSTIEHRTSCGKSTTPAMSNTSSHSYFGFLSTGSSLIRLASRIVRSLPRADALTPISAATKQRTTSTLTSTAYPSNLNRTTPYKIPPRPPLPITLTCRVPMGVPTGGRPSAATLAAVRCTPPPCTCTATAAQGWRDRSRVEGTRHRHGCLR